MSNESAPLNTPSRVTVAICTHNRADFLDSCLHALKLANQYENFPIIVIDNASTDHTAKVALRHEVAYFFEPTLGLSHARNRALSLVQSEFLVFLDDDGAPNESWCAAIKEGIEKHNPDVFGGPYTPYYLSHKPDWFLDEFGSAHLELADGMTSDTVCFSGGNMGWRTALLKQVGGFDPKLGMTGGKLGLGEETAIQITLRNQPNIRRACFSAMTMKHYVPPAKMKLSYIARRSFQYGYQILDIDPEAPVITKSHSLGFARRSRLGLPLLYRLAVRNRTATPCWSTFAAQYLSLHMIEAGVLWRKHIGNG